MDIEHQLTSIFCELDDFCNELDNNIKSTLLPGPNNSKGTRGPECGLTNSEIATILIMFHRVRFRDFKTFYCSFVQELWPKYFPRLPTYQRFIELLKRAILPLTLFIHVRSGKRNNTTWRAISFTRPSGMQSLQLLILC